MTKGVLFFFACGVSLGGIVESRRQRLCLKGQLLGPNYQCKILNVSPNPLGK